MFPVDDRLEDPTVADGGLLPGGTKPRRMEVGLLAQRDNSRAVAVASDIRAALAAASVDCRLDPTTAAALEVSTETDALGGFDACDLVVSVGGDGTFLFAARAAGGVPIMGVNLGEVGFLNAVAPDEAVSAVREEVRAIRDGTQTVREAPRLTAACEGFESTPAVNEIVVSGPRRGHGGGATVEVAVDGSPYSGGHADGVMVATPTGSTAYNLSEGGPIVHPSAGGLIINEMCPTDGMPPLVVDGDCAVEVSVTDADHAIVVSDGRRPSELETPVTLTVSRAEPPVRLAGPVADFFEALGKLS
jgi:NAD+ kinase